MSDDKLAGDDPVIMVLYDEPTDFTPEAVRQITVAVDWGFPRARALKRPRKPNKKHRPPKDPRKRGEWWNRR